MTKRMKNVDTRTQQVIRTSVERNDDDLEVKIRASTDLDDELRSEFREEIDALNTETVSVGHRTYRSNQGNELGEDVTARFAAEEKLCGLDVVYEVVQIGKEYHKRQLERDLGREADGAAGSQSENNLLYFDDDDIKKFCLLYQGWVDV